MRTSSIIAAAVLLSLGGNAALYAQAVNAHPIGVSREHVLSTRTSVVAWPDTAGATPQDREGRNWSETAVGALMGGAVGLAISILSYKACADHSAGSEKSICGIAVMVIMPAAVGGGAIIGDVLGIVHARSGH